MGSGLLKWLTFLNIIKMLFEEEIELEDKENKSLNKEKTLKDKNILSINHFFVSINYNKNDITT